MSALDRVLIDKLESLTPERLAEVEDFIDFLASKERRRAALDRLLTVAPALKAAGAEPLSEDEAVELVREARAARRGQPDRADRP